MKEHTKAYAAGLTDAEGTFTITHCRHNTLGHMLYDPTIRIASTYKPVLTWMVDNFGGTIYNRKPSETYKQRWDWSTDGYKHSSLFISQIMPYLTLKKEEAAVLEEFYGLYRQQVPKLRQQLFEKLQDMKIRESVTTETQSLLHKENEINAYFAGFFDGEGSIGFYTNNGYKDAIATLGNTAKRLLNTMKQQYGGAVYVLGGESRPEHHQDMFQWQLNRKDLLESFTLKVLPYLQIKREEALKVLEFIRSKRMIQSDLIGDYKSAPVETQRV